MKNIKFTSANIKNFRREYQEAIDQISQKYGLSAELGRITYDDSEFRCKLTISSPSLQFASIIAPASVINENDRESIIGKSFKLRNSIYTITEVKSPGVYIGVTQRGKRYKIPVSVLKNSMVEV